MKFLKRLFLSAALLLAPLAQAAELQIIEGINNGASTSFSKEGVAVVLAVQIAVSDDDPTDLITYIDERIAAATGTTPATHTRYFGLSTDRVIDASDFSSARTSSTDTGAWPSNAGNAYLWFAEPESVGYPTGLYRPPNPVNQIGFWSQQSGTVTVNGVAYVVGVSLNQFVASSETRPVRLEH